MKKTNILLFTLLCWLPMRAQGIGEDASAEKFSEWYQTSSLVNYINYISEDMLWESETTGNWARPDRMLFSIRGNSYEWNRFYLNGFRLDSRFLSGSMLYVPDMMQTALHTDAERGVLYLRTLGFERNQLSVEGNMGGLAHVGGENGIGGVSWGTRQLINLFHSSALERLHKPIEQRNRQLWAGSLDAGFGIPSNSGKRYHQRLYADFGNRRIVTFDEGGENGFYDAAYYKIQLDGELPLGQKAAADGLSLHYLFNTQHRPDLYSELGYGAEEVAAYQAYSASVYLKRENNCQKKANADRLQLDGHTLTTGITYAMHDAERHNRNYERNIVDQDGEGFDPWYADGQLHELSWAVNYAFQPKQHNPLTLRLDAYNSLLCFRQAANEWHHNLYIRYPDQPREDWYRYDFSGNDFAAGMLENTLALDYEMPARNHWFSLRASAGIACDGIIMSKKTILTPSVEAELQMHFHPTRWFDAQVILGHYRTKYTWNQVRLLSDDYQNGTLSGSYAPYPYYGGKYLSVRKAIQQPQYALLDLPIVFKVKERHSFSILTTARLYYHNWTITNNPAIYPTAATDATTANDNTRPYLLTYQEPVKGAGLFALPLYLSNTVKYQYDGRHVFFSLSWQSYQMSGLTTFGNGAENNSISTLQYAMLNPTLGENLSNAESPVRRLGRLDQDKAFICRLQMGANITPNWQLMLNFHFQDGTPITKYVTNSGKLYALTTKGINPADGHFGQRKDAFFNLDMRLAYRGNINCRNQQLGLKGAIPFSVELLGYNLYDFGTAWYEYSFDQYITETRRTLSLCIPRGLNLKLCIGLCKNE